MQKGKLRIRGRAIKINEEESVGTPYEFFRFNRFDALLRQEGYMCVRINSVRTMKYAFHELSETVAGKMAYLDRNAKSGSRKAKFDEPIVIIPAYLVLINESLLKLANQERGREKVPASDFYAIYRNSNPRVAHREYPFL